MPRPKDADSAVTYDRILQTATQLIEREGVAAMTLRRVANESDQSLGAINYYFESRGGLLEACLEQPYAWMSDLVTDALARIAGGGSWQDEVSSFVRTLFREARGHRSLIRSRLLTTMKAGALPPGRLERELLPALDKIATALGGSKAVVELRLAAHSLELIVIRYALHTDEECMAITGSDELEPALALMEDHLVRLSQNAFAEAMKVI